MKKSTKYPFILIIAFSFFYVASAITNTCVSSTVENTMITVFEKTDAEILEANITTTLEVPYTIWNKEEIFIIKEDIKRQLGLEDKKEIFLDNEEVFSYEDEVLYQDSSTLFIYQFSDITTNQIIATNTNEKGDILTFKIHSQDLQGEKTSYIIIDIIHNKRYKDIVEESNQSLEILSQYGNKINTTINLVGVYNGNILDSQGKKKLKEIITSVKGKVVEEVVTQSYLSTTIYTPIINNTIEYDKKKVNLHLAMRYNSYEDKTYLYIANPLITLTY